MSSTGTYISYLSTSSKALAANFGWNFKIRKNKQTKQNKIKEMRFSFLYEKPQIIVMLLLTATTLALVPFDFADVSGKYDFCLFFLYHLTYQFSLVDRI